MAAIFIQQPNGLYCRFSTIVDCPTCYNFTVEDVKEYLMKEYEEEVDRRVAKMQEGNNPWNWSFEDVIEQTLHGEYTNMSEEEFNTFVEQTKIPVMEE